MKPPAGVTSRAEHEIIYKSKWAINLINPIREFSIAEHYTGTIDVWRKFFARG